MDKTSLHLAGWGVIARTRYEEPKHVDPTDYKVCVLFLMENGACMDEIDCWYKSSGEYIEGLKAELRKALEDSK